MRCCRSFLITTLPPEDSTPQFLLIVRSLCPSGRTPRTPVRLRLRASGRGKTRRNTCASAPSCPSKNQEKPNPKLPHSLRRCPIRHRRMVKILECAKGLAVFYDGD